MKDFLLELRIEYHHYLALLFDLYGRSDRANYHWKVAFHLVRQRSPQQVAKMEKRLGLG